MAKPVRKARRGGWLRLGAALASMAVTGVVAALLLGVAFLVEMNRPGPLGADVTVTIPRGASGDAIAAHLEERGVIRSDAAFQLAARGVSRGAALKAGEFAIPAGASLRQVIDILSSGRSLLHPITVPEGYTSAMAIDVIAASPVLTGEPPPVPPEGAILPETYMVPRGTSRAELLQKMIDARNRAIDELWKSRASDLPFQTKEEAIILASIVERETGLASERPRVAAVFVNRLRRGMRLESDPTIIYGISQGRPLGRGILRSEIDRKTPYNTYQIDGLPPTPIANPGRDAIAAVLNPPKTNEVFFVAIDPFDYSKGHVFSETYEQHRAAVQRLREAERAARVER